MMFAAILACFPLWAAPGDDPLAPGVLLQKLREADSRYESDFTVTGTIGGSEKWKLTAAGGALAYEKDTVRAAKPFPRFAELRRTMLVTPEHYFRFAWLGSELPAGPIPPFPEGEKGPFLSGNIEGYDLHDPTCRTWIDERGHLLGRWFSKYIASIESVSRGEDGLVSFTAKGGIPDSDLYGLEWEITVDPASDYLVRKALRIESIKGERRTRTEIITTGLLRQGRLCVAEKGEMKVDRVDLKGIRMVQTCTSLLAEPDLEFLRQASRSIEGPYPFHVDVDDRRRDPKSRQPRKEGPWWDAAFRAKTTASSSKPGHEGKRINDRRPDRWWESGEGGEKGCWLELAWGEPAAFDRVFIDERVDEGARIEAWRLEAGDADLKEIARGKAAGRLFSVDLPGTVKAKRLRLTIEKASAPPAISELGAIRSLLPRPAEKDAGGEGKKQAIGMRMPAGMGRLPAAFERTYGGRDARQWLYPGSRPREAILAEPRYRSAKPVYFSAVYGDSEDNVFTLVADESGGTGRGYDVLYADADNDNRLDEEGEEHPLRLGVSEAIPALCVEISISAGGALVPYSFAFRAFHYDHERFPGQPIHAIATDGSWYLGEVELEGKRRLIALADLDSNGLFDRRPAGAIDTTGERSLDRFSGDFLYADLDGNGPLKMFPPHAVQRERRPGGRRNSADPGTPACVQGLEPAMISRRLR